MIPLKYIVNVKVFAFMAMALMLQACSHSKKIYESECDNDQTFKQVNFKNLVDSFANYDNQYVQVKGKFEQDKEMSVLIDDSLVSKGNKRVLLVDFSQDCPLYLKGTRTGFFDYDTNNGQLTPVNNKTITIRGKINIRNKGKLNAYKGTIEHISYVML
jgi:starvation-inducible outer membrane lipoprotein